LASRVEVPFQTLYLAGKIRQTITIYEIGRGVPGQ
jgi:hypothetical protein